MLLLWVIYDISDNRIRTRTSEVCKDHGLFRVQKSVFFGELDFNGITVLLCEIKNIVDDEDKKEEDSFLILPVCRSCIQKKIEVGRKIDLDQYMEHEYVIVD
jgi:CRISPR-associated protein Cas2